MFAERDARRTEPRDLSDAMSARREAGDDVILTADRLVPLLGREVARVELERAPQIDAVRAVAIHFPGGSCLPVPPGNRLRSAGDVVEVRALLEGFSRRVAARARAGLGDARPDQALVESALAALREELP